MNRQDSYNLFAKNTTYAFSNILELNRINDKRYYPKLTMIIIDNINKFNTKLPVLSFKIRDEENHIENELYTSIHLILANIVNNKYNKGVDEEMIKFSKLLKSNTIEELRENFRGDEEYMSGIEKIEDLISDPNFAGAYDLEERRKWDLEDMKETGIRIGLKEGISTRNIEIAKAMLKKNMEIEDISEITGLTVEEINRL